MSRVSGIILMAFVFVYAIATAVAVFVGIVRFELVVVSDAIVGWLALWLMKKYPMRWRD